MLFPPSKNTTHKTKKKVTNLEFSAFVNATGYVTTSERYGWSFVFHLAASPEVSSNVTSSVAGAPWWLQVHGADWRHPEGGDRDVLLEGRTRHPVVQVSWGDAQAFCSWRGGARLPTEAEWEYAARGGRENRIFPWGNKWVDGGRYRGNIWQGSFPRDNSGEDGYLFLSPVDAYGPQNDFGIYGLVGNAWEWVQDWWTVDHPVGAMGAMGDEGDDIGVVKDPQGPDTGTEKVKKGRSFLCHKQWCYRYRSAARTKTDAESATLNNGFRCARSSHSNTSIDTSTSTSTSVDV